MRVLCLTRKPDQSIVIDFGGVAVWVTVLEVDNGKCRLGIQAPPAVRINREEIYELRQRDGK